MYSGFDTCGWGDKVAPKQKVGCWFDPIPAPCCLYVKVSLSKKLNNDAFDNISTNH